MVKKQNKSSKGLSSSARKKTKKQRSVPRPPSKRIAVHMPETTEMYLKSLCDPSQYRNAGIPSSDNVGAVISLKQHVFGKGTMTIGASGWGYVWLAPGIAAANTSPCVGFSSAAWNLNTLDINVVNPGQTYGNSNSMFTTADFGVAPLAQYRIVSAGLKIRYSGTELNKGGTVRALQHPNHDSLIGLSAAQIEGYVQSKRFPVTREWSQTVYCPLTDGYNTNTTTLTLPYGTPSQGFLVSSTSGNEFEFEYVVNYEVTGRNVRGQTVCFKDPVGYAAITSAMAVEGGSFHGAPVKMEKTISGLVKEYLTKAATWVGESVMEAIPIVVEHAPSILSAVAAMI